MWNTFKEAVQFRNKSIPVALIGTERFFSDHYGSSVIDFATDFDIMMEAELSVFRKYSSILFIPGVWPDFSAPIILPSAFGAKIRWFDDAPAAVTNFPIENIQDFLEEKIGDIRKLGIVPWYLQGLKKFLNNGNFKDYMNFAWSIGPGELSGYLLGYTVMFTTLMDNPELLYRFIEKCTDIIIDFLTAQFETVPSLTGLLITDDISGLISREQYEAMLKPQHQRIREYFHDKIIVFHNDTASDHIIESLADIGFDVFNFGPTTDIDLLLQYMVWPKKTAIMGGLDPTGTLLGSNVEHVRSKIAQVLTIAEKNPGFIISAGGGLNATSKDIIQLFSEVAGKAVCLK